MAWPPRSRERRHRRRIGLWAPEVAIDEALEEAAATEEQRAKKRERSAKARERREAEYRNEVAEAIHRFLAFAPEHVDLADEIATEAATRAAAVGSGRVGRTQTAR